MLSVVGREERKEGHEWGRNDESHRDSRCPAPELKEIGSTEYWSVETLPQKGHIPQVESGGASFLRREDRRSSIQIERGIKVVRFRWKMQIWM